MAMGLYESDFYRWTIEQSEKLRSCEVDGCLASMTLARLMRCSWFAITRSWFAWWKVKVLPRKTIACSVLDAIDDNWFPLVSFVFWGTPPIPQTYIAASRPNCVDAMWSLRVFEDFNTGDRTASKAQRSIAEIKHLPVYAQDIWFPPCPETTA